MLAAITADTSHSTASLFSSLSLHLTYRFVKPTTFSKQRSVTCISMNNSGTIAWKNKAVGSVTNVTSDMWCLNADWRSAKSDASVNFESIASNLKSEEIIKDPAKGMIAVLRYDDALNSPQHVLMLSLDKSKIFMRVVSDEVAAYADMSLLEPWQQTDNPAFYETELKKEVGIFNPLYWRKVRAVGIRTDRDDVLFEVTNGRNRYVVVHLTYAKNRSGKFLITQYYKDWADVYTNRLLPDRKEWQSDQVPRA